MGQRKEKTYSPWPRASCPFVFLHPPAMLIFMAIDAEVLPVRSIGRIVVVVAVPVVDCQEVPVFLFKLTAAFCTDQAVDLKGLLAVTNRL